MMFLVFGLKTWGWIEGSGTTPNELEKFFREHNFTASLLEHNSS